MKEFYQNLNTLWMRYKNWGKSSLLGDIVASTIKAVLVAIVFLFVLNWLLEAGFFEEEVESSTSSYLSDSNGEDTNCSVLGLSLNGFLATYIPKHSEVDTNFNYDTTSSDFIVEMLHKVNDDPRTKAVVIEVDSGGGSPVAGEEVARALKDVTKPKVAYIRNIGGSSSYWAISTSDKIFASRNSSVGSIGITASYVSNAEKNRKDGYTYEELASGKFKDSGMPEKPLTSEERALILRDVNIMYQNFMEDVAKNRNLEIDKVKSFADGSVVLGDKAKEFGLIDAIGGINEAEQYIEEKIGEKPVICWR